jgi:transposase
MNSPVMPDIPREELWLIACNLAIEVAEVRAENSELRAKLAQANETIQALQAQLALPKKTVNNSSIPPSVSHKPQCEKGIGKPRGGKPGHLGTSRSWQEPDVVIDCRAEACHSCGASLSGVEGECIGSHQVVELPPTKALVVEFRLYRTSCTCGAYEEGRYPAGYDDVQQDFGPNVQALVSYLNGTHHIAQDRLAQLLQDVFDVPMSAGAIANSLRRTATHLERPAHDILCDIRRSPVIGSDETGFRVEGENWWLWTLQNPESSYFAIADTRAGAVLEGLMFDAIAEVWYCDLHAAQLKAPARRFAICNAHQIRDLQYAIDAGDTVFAPPMQALLREGLRLTQERDKHSPLDYQQAVDNLKAKARALLELTPQQADAVRLQKRFRKHFESIWHFLDRPDVPFTNNASERALRPAVIHRKVIGGFRSEAGAVAYALYRTIEDTARKRGQNILKTLVRALTGSSAPALANFKFPIQA